MLENLLPWSLYVVPGAPNVSTGFAIGLVFTRVIVISQDFNKDY